MPVWQATMCWAQRVQLQKVALQPYFLSLALLLAQHHSTCTRILVLAPRWMDMGLSTCQSNRHSDRWLPSSTSTLGQHILSSQAVVAWKILQKEHKRGDLIETGSGKSWKDSLKKWDWLHPQICPQNWKEPTNGPLHLFIRHKLITSITKRCPSIRGFPGCINGKEPACQCRRHKRHGFDSWIGKSPWRRAWQSTQVFLPGESQGQRSPLGYSAWGHKRIGHDCSDLAHPHTLPTINTNQGSLVKWNWRLIANFISLQGTLMKNLLCTKNSVRHQDEGRLWS